MKLQRKFLKTIKCVCSMVVILLCTFSTTRAQEPDKILREIIKHDKAVHILKENISNPKIHIGPDGYYYLTGTISADTQTAMKFWRSQDLVNWEVYGTVKPEEKFLFSKELVSITKKAKIEPKIYAPEVQFIAGRWVIVHSSNVLLANLMRSESHDVLGSYTEPLGLVIGFQKDPSIFVDTDYTPWLISNCTQVRKIKKDFSGFDGNHKLIGPIDRLLGFEGSSMIKIGDKYVLFGSSWSTDVYGKGTYNLYYATADKVIDHYSPRKFAGRFIGNGAPFKDKEGRWWAIAFPKAENSVSTISGLKELDLTNSSYTINKPGITLVPLSIEEANGEIIIKTKDINYQLPGNEEVQKF